MLNDNSSAGSGYLARGLPAPPACFGALMIRLAAPSAPSSGCLEDPGGSGPGRPHLCRPCHTASLSVA